MKRAGLLLWHVKVALLYAGAWIWRRLLFRTTFIAITGSFGKTTAKDCLAAILASKHPTAKSRFNQNDYSGVPLSILRVRPWHRFAVLETAGQEPGLARRSGRLVRPDVMIVLKVGRAHMKDMKTPEAVAASKSLLVRAMGPRGIAVLNADDPLVAGMAAGLRQRVVFFGSTAEYLVSDVVSPWPDRLSFQLGHGADCVPVVTRLVGRHWVNSVVGALAAAHVCGVPLVDAARALEAVEPTLGRMQPAPTPCGAVFLRDENGGSVESLARAFEAMAEASATRRILVIEDVTDSSRRRSQRFRDIGREAAAIFQMVVFLGDGGPQGVRGAVEGGLSPDCAHHFYSHEAAAAFLKGELTAGDLVLLRGSIANHITRLYYAMLGSVACTRDRCGKRILCDLCPELGASTLVNLPQASPSIE